MQMGKAGNCDEQLLPEAIYNMKKDMDLLEALNYEGVDHSYYIEDDFHPYDRLYLLPDPDLPPAPVPLARFGLASFTYGSERTTTMLQGLRILGTFSYGLDKDLQYVSLHLKIEDSPSIKWDKTLEHNRSTALLLKKDYALLSDKDVTLCVSEYMHLERVAEVNHQKYKASLKLLNDENAKEVYLKNPNELKKLMEEYPLVIAHQLSGLVMLHVSDGWSLPKCERKSIANEITIGYEYEKERIQRLFSRARYIKSKLEKAQKIGLIKVDLPWLSKVEAVHSDHCLKNILKEIEEAEWRRKKVKRLQKKQRKITLRLEQILKEVKGEEAREKTKNDYDEAHEKLRRLAELFKEADEEVKRLREIGEESPEET